MKTSPTGDQRWFEQLSTRAWLPLCLITLMVDLVADPSSTSPAEPQMEPGDSAAAYLEPQAGWMATTLDARQLKGAAVEDNLAVRGLVFRLGPGAYGCFDTDLLRWSVIWHGDFISYRSMATQSYFQPGVKNSGGQTALCQPMGTPLSVTALHPGVFVGAPALIDPRDRGLDPRDLGRGPLKLDQARWHDLRREAGGNWLSYEIGGTLIREVSHMQASNDLADWVRCLEVGPHAQELLVVMGSMPGAIFKRDTQDGASGSWHFEDESAHPIHAWVRSDASAADLLWDANHEVLMARLAPSESAARIRLFVGQHRRGIDDALTALNSLTTWPSHDPAPARWSEPLSTTWHGVSEEAGMIQEQLPLPDPNPWQRKVRASAMAFDAEGKLFLTTFDGDLWLAAPSPVKEQTLTWRRVAAGLHEPMSVCLRDGDPFVYTRNGIIQLRDLDGDGDYETHQNFCNDFTQTAETREFAMAMIQANDGSFYLAKSGQQLTYQGVDNGKILRVSPDGKHVETVAMGLRQPYVAYAPKWDLLTASDQQGHWVPSTPVHWIRPGHHYGFRPSAEVVPPSQPITEPLCWIPHRVVQSGADQIWLGDQAMGPLNQTLIYLDYYRPRLVSVFPDSLPHPEQAAVAPLPFSFEVPLLKAVQHPINHWLHLVGFRIWGSNASQWAGLVRLRPSGVPAPILTEVRGFQEGVFLRFAQPLEPSSALNRSHYAIQRWDYQRSSGYGSGYYREEGQAGIERVPVRGVILTPDQRGIFLLTENARPVMQMEVVYRINASRQQALEGSAYLTLHRLPAADWQALGLTEPPASLSAASTVSPLAEVPAQSGPPTVAQGQELYQSMGCMACHSLDGSTQGRVGPSFAGLWGQERQFARGPNRLADEAYVRESILDPSARILSDFAESDIGMPSYRGVLSDQQIDCLIALIKSLD